MNISIKSTHLPLISSIKQYAEEKVRGMEKYISGPIEAKIELERSRKHRSGEIFRAELMLIVGGKIMRAEADGEDIYAAIDLAIPKLREQISKFKDRRATLQKRGARSAKRKT
ncbi:MAG: ribosome-associated translation inhibitor RaiA [Candidatus Doudnabacteria bacterium]|nr:ribosome-associated translation inhibitor RaiA [Candidatus Doudnabacteria bacterium]